MQEPPQGPETDPPFDGLHREPGLYPAWQLHDGGSRPQLYADLGDAREPFQGPPHPGGSKAAEHPRDLHGHMEARGVGQGLHLEEAGLRVDQEIVQLESHGLPREAIAV